LLACAGARTFFAAHTFSIFLPALERAHFLPFIILLSALCCLPVLEHAGARAFSKAWRFARYFGWPRWPSHLVFLAWR
jgi:hypothetical protein